MASTWRRSSRRVPLVRARRLGIRARWLDARLGDRPGVARGGLALRRNRVMVKRSDCALRRVYLTRNLPISISRFRQGCSTLVAIGLCQQTAGGGYWAWGVVLRTPGAAVGVGGRFS